MEREKKKTWLCNIDKKKSSSKTQNTHVHKTNAIKLEQWGALNLPWSSYQCDYL